MRRSPLYFLVAATTCFLGATFPSKAAFPPPAEGQMLAVATDNAEATRAAVDALHGGGNAFDGAIAAALTLGVTSPTASGIGGGGFMVAWIAKEKKLVALDFRERAPADVDVQELVDRKKRGVVVGVPGEPAGLEYLSTHWAKRPLQANAAYAVALATQGFPVGKHLADGSARFTMLIHQSKDLEAMFMPGGSPIAFRALLRRPELGQTLARYSQDGSKLFYTGDLAQKIVDAVKAEGGRMTLADLASYKVVERPPLVRTIGSRTVATMPAPSAGGLMLMELLLMYGADEKSPLKAMGFGSSLYIHTISEAMRGAIADRARLVGDPYVDPDVDKAVAAALEPGQLAARKAKIDPNKTHPATDFLTREEGTSHLIVTDPEGNVVCLTTTVNAPFGARIVAPGTGVLLNDELDDFGLPEDVQGFGVVGLGPNHPHGNARPVSSMAPTIVLENNKPILAVGGSGGRRIATEVTQATLARLIFGLDASACVSSPRIFTNGKEVMVEPEFAEDVRAGLRARGETVTDERMNFSAAQMMVWSNGRIFAASDPRKAGFSAAQ
jgi:gamma-glutamyltranspeptidase/glutathione hydrolase